MTSIPPPPAPPEAVPPYGSPPPEPPPPPGSPASPRTLRRSRTDKVIGGVAGGLAEYTGVDALLWRVGAIALTLAGGSGVLVYLLLWLLMPVAPKDPTAAPAVRTSQPAGPRSPVPGVTAATLLILVGVAVLLHQFTDVSLSARGFLGTALLVVGVGLVVTAVTGAGRGARGGLIALGLVLSIASIAASTQPWERWHGDVGDRTYHPLTADAVQSTYDAGLGNTTVDLSDVDLTGAATPIRTQVDGGVGNLHVRVPASADVQVSVDRGMGNVDVLGSGSTDGFYPGTGSASWTDDGRPEFVLTIDAGIGNVEVDRA
jgi:phage shock protein PspC (stress-responsive transcriptional regulator)